MGHYCLYDGQELRHLKDTFYLCETCKTVWRNTARYTETPGEIEWSLQEINAISQTIMEKKTETKLMSDPRAITRIDDFEINLASNEYYYLIDRSGMPEGVSSAAIATDVFRSKDGVTWEKWEENNGSEDTKNNLKVATSKEEN